MLNPKYLGMNFEKELQAMPEARKNAVQHLEAALKNPGRFSILLLGERGTGKSHWLEKLTERLGQKLITLHPAFSEDTHDWWQKQFVAADNGTLAIDEADQLSQKSQDILFRILSTTDGKFGWPEKSLEVRIVFISSIPVSNLRDTDDVFSHQFFDRIGQLIVEMPNLKSINKGELWRDFLATWDKMKFSTKKPGQKWQVWLENHQGSLHGNFRDLDKICINYDHFLQMESDEDAALERTKSDFRQLFHFPEQQVDSDITFEFETGKTKLEIDKDYRRKFKIWAKKTYGTYEKAAKALQCSSRTFEKM